MFVCAYLYESLLFFVVLPENIHSGYGFVARYLFECFLVPFTFHFDDAHTVFVTG